ncbi:DUF2922 domain-containing protein [Enterococcus sp. 669A]|uniref:DUF2922 domain-containing protein n=1 Tax=Candidatus Enterococcus moelleringii TaxID=2815325 RepID=A0ABS3LBX2_9ENTE|nr:DUF2922 domain-containing protein [Enterococcus sp. 669A]MBO1307135.1 DUF2922 domain-containing protein [Enterococcus sp. 669A]
MPETKLVVRFRNEQDKIHSWSYDKPNTSKTPAEIKAAMEELTELHLFKKHGIHLFTSVVSAEFVTVQETKLF